MATIRQKVLANLIQASLNQVSDEKGKDLFSFMAPSDKSVMEELFQLWGDRDEAKGRLRLQKLIRLNQLSLLGEIHPGWILEKLGNESPRLLQALRYFLSAEQIQYLRVHLQPEIRKVFGAEGQPEAEILQLIRPLIEKKLGIVMPSRTGGAFTLTHLGWIKASDQRILFRQLGLTAIAKAFSGVEARTLKVFLSRFSLPMVQEIRSQFHKAGRVSTAEKKGAQSRLFALSLDQIPAEKLFEEVGYSIFARSLYPEEKNQFEIVALRMKPAEGYRLKKRIDETHVSREESTRTREYLLETIFKLAEQGLIHKFWRQEIETTVTEKKVA